MGNLKFISMLILLLVIPGTQVHALDEDEFVFGIEAGKTYKWKATTNDVIPLGYSLEFDISVVIDSISTGNIEYTIQQTLIGGDIDLFNEKFPEAEIYEGMSDESKITNYRHSWHRFFVPSNADYPSYIEQLLEDTEIRDHLFAYTIYTKMAQQSETTVLNSEEKRIVSKNSGLVVYYSLDMISQNIDGEIQSHYQEFLEYQGIEALANPRILAITIGFSAVILVALVVLLYLWRKKKKNSLPL